ncbi:nitrite/sulfite reductase [Nocardioides maradonensis]
MSRTRADLCPGALRPWPASDGLLVRLRLIGGRVSAATLRSLVAVAEEYADGRIHVTGRANLQVRGFSGLDRALTPAALRALQDTGLLPTRSHELVRNVLASPGLDRLDHRWGALLDELDRRLCADPVLAGLSARFLFVLDDGSGDLVERSCDLGLVVLSDTEAQLRVGDGWGDVVRLEEAAARLAGLAVDFVRARGSGPTAPWHVRELAEPLTAPVEPDPRVPAPSGPLPYDERHLAVPDEGLDRAAVEALPDGPLVVTPWRGLLLPALTEEIR